MHVTKRARGGREGRVEDPPCFFFSIGILSRHGWSLGATVQSTSLLPLVSNKKIRLTNVQSQTMWWEELMGEEDRTTHARFRNVTTTTVAMTTTLQSTIGAAGDVENVRGLETGKVDGKGGEHNAFPFLFCLRRFSCGVVAKKKRKQTRMRTASQRAKRARGCV